MIQVFRWILLILFNLVFYVFCVFGGEKHQSEVKSHI